MTPDPTDMDESRRCKRLVVTGWTLANLFQTDNLVIVADGVPKDSSLVRIYSEPEKDEVHLIYECDSFDVVDEGDVIPTMDVEIEIREARTSWTTNTP